MGDVAFHKCVVEASGFADKKVDLMANIDEARLPTNDTFNDGIKFRLKG